jgi:hypothetical protein
MAKITDPDSLVRSSSKSNLGTDGNIWIDTATKRISLGLYGDLSNDGVTLQAVYSYLKEEWKTDADLIKFPFPMVAITPEQFEFVDGWQSEDASTENLYRDGGFAIQDNAGYASKMTAGIITLGDIGSGDQVYYQQEAGGSAKNIVLTGAVNQVVKVYAHGAGTDIAFAATGKEITSTSTDLGVFDVGDTIVITGSSDNDGTYTVASVVNATKITVNESLTDESAGASVSMTTDYRGYFKIFVREQAKLYAQSQQSDIGVTQFTYQAYRFPLANDIDLKITHTDTEIDSNGDGTADQGKYADMNITYYATNQQRDIGGTDYDFNIIIDADVAGDGGYPTAEEIYEFVEWSLRQNSDIDAGAGTVIGKTADSLLKFVGDTLVTSTGVFIDNFSETDINRIEFYDVTGTKRTYPFVAAGVINFNDNLVQDSGAIYKMFFTDANGNNFDDSDAIIVQDNHSNDIAGNISSSSVQFTFDYDGNTQGGRTAGTDAPITVVAIGLDKAQYVKATSTIGRSNANSVSLVASLERNYSNP